MTDINPHSVLISGESGAGKSMTLYEMRNRKDVLYLNCDGGKPLPFKHSFVEKVIVDPNDILDYLQELEPGEPGDGLFNFVVIDTVSFMMDLFETRHIHNSANSQKMWGEYAHFFKKIITASSQVNAFFIYIGHSDRYLDEDAGIYRSSVPVKGALAKRGLEAYFTNVITVAKQTVKVLNKHSNELLNLSDRDKDLGFKHVFQTMTTKQTVGDRIRSPMGMWDEKEVYIDNDLVPVIKRIIAYYSD